jgi:hypothetical protein
VKELVPIAHVGLGFMYLEGNDVAQNYMYAHMWLGQWNMMNLKR